MTKLQTLHKQMAKEQKRIKMLKNTKSSGDYDSYEWLDSEIKKAKNKIKELKIEFDNEYKYQQS